MKKFLTSTSQPLILEDNNPPPPPANDPPPPKTFTQDQVNAMLAENKRGLQASLSEAQQTLAQLQQEGLTVEAKAELQQKLATLEESLLSEKERARLEKERAIKAKEEEKEAVAKERDTFKKKYFDHLIDTSILQAAASPTSKAYNPNQLLAMLRPSASIVEVEGKDVTHLTINAVNDKNKPITLTLPVAEALAEFAKDKNNQNLFASEGTDGLGFRRGAANNNPQDGLKGMSFKEYEKNRGALLQN